MEKVLITGSEGTIGKIITPFLRSKGYEIITIDKKAEHPFDILRDDLRPCLKKVKYLIHLAANPDPTIKEKEARKNFDITKRIVDQLDDAESLEVIVNASSINVYDYLAILEEGRKLTSTTRLSPNKRWSDGSYGEYKIKSEEALEEYCKKKGISLVNLRIGCITPNEELPRKSDGTIDPVDFEIALKHKDMRNIAYKTLKQEGIHSYVCVSKKDGFIDQSILFPLN